MNVSFHSPTPRTSVSGKSHKQTKQHGFEDMELDHDHEEDSKDSGAKDPTLHVVTPGEVITADTAFMRYILLPPPLLPLIASDLLEQNNDIS